MVAPAISGRDAAHFRLRGECSSSTTACAQQNYAGIRKTQKIRKSRNFVLPISPPSYYHTLATCAEPAEELWLCKGQVDATVFTPPKAGFSGCNRGGSSSLLKTAQAAEVVEEAVPRAEALPKAVTTTNCLLRWIQRICAERSRDLL